MNREAQSFDDRRDAGRRLAEKLLESKVRPDLVLALPRGGVPVGYEVASALQVPLDVLIVRKLGVPGREELAMGAIASGGITVLNDAVVSLVSHAREAVDRAIARETEELQRREKVYRGDRAPLELGDKVIVLIDDGLATGATMKAAVRALKQGGVKRCVVAVPVGSKEARDSLLEEADEVLCLSTPDPFYAVGEFYRNFEQTSDEEVTRLLAS